MAIATPGIALVLLFRDEAMIPASPPKNATPTSSIVGIVRELNSSVSCPRGVIAKYAVAAMSPITVAAEKLATELLRSGMSNVAMPIPIPSIVDMMGEISIAPMMMLAELTSRPMQAINAPRIRSQP